MAQPSFSERLQAVLDDLGENVHSFAKRANVGDSTLRNYLSGRSQPTLDKFLSIARAAEVDIAWLATGEGEMRPATARPAAVDSLTQRAGRMQRHEEPEAEAELARLRAQIEILQDTLAKGFAATQAGFPDIRAEMAPGD